MHGQAQVKRLSEVIAEAGQWLLRNHPRWETFVEDDKDVQGTAWVHMAYALCTRAAIRSGAHPRDARLARAWRLMNDFWDAEAGMWNEPGASGKRATIRAAYCTVSAYREAQWSLARLGLREDDEPSVDDITEAHITSTVLAPERTLLLSTPDRDAPVECVLPERLFDLVKAVHADPDQGLTTEAIAQALFVARSSVPKYVQRLNQAVSTAFGGAPVRVLIASTVDGASGYRLAGLEKPISP